MNDNFWNGFEKRAAGPLGAVWKGVKGLMGWNQMMSGERALSTLNKRNLINKGPGIMDYSVKKKYQKPFDAAKRNLMVGGARVGATGLAGAYGANKMMS